MQLVHNLLIYFGLISIVVADLLILLLYIYTQKKF
jgi:hypothetical protein